MGYAAGIEATRACNFRCTHCFVDAGARPKNELSTTEMASLIESLVSAGASEIGWSGGEPLLRKDLDELTAHAVSLGARVGLPSNGYFATRERLESLQRAGLSSLQISIDGVDRPRAERFRIGPSDAFERAVRAVELGVELGFGVAVCALLTPESAAELGEMIEFAQKLGAGTLRYTPYSPFGRASGPTRGSTYDDNPWASSAVKEFLKIAEQERNDQFRILLDCPIGPTPLNPAFRCGAGRSLLYVCANGDVFPCTALMSPDYLVGNIRERPIDELLRDPKMFLVQRELVREPPRGKCRECEAVEKCRGGCPGRAHATFGSTRDGAPACFYRLHR